MKTPEIKSFADLLARGRLISLMDMHTYLASRLASVGQGIASIGLSTFSWENNDPADRTSVKSWLGVIIQESEFIGLKITKKGAERFLNSLDGFTPDKSREIAGALDELSFRFHDELDGVKLFYVRPEKLKWFENAEIAGAKFKVGFPKSNYELMEAGSCFALDRNTACVCHLMRALEYALRSFEKELGIPSPAPGYYQSNTWGDIIQRISEKRGHPGISTAGRPNIPKLEKSSEWLKDPDFNENAYTFLNAIKTPFRDRTFHVESAYDESSAMKVLEMSKNFLEHCATKLEEIR